MKRLQQDRAAKKCYFTAKILSQDCAGSCKKGSSILSNRFPLTLLQQIFWPLLGRENIIETTMRRCPAHQRNGGSTMKYDAKYIKENLYSGIICDVLDQMGYRHQAFSAGFPPAQPVSLQTAPTPPDGGSTAPQKTHRVTPFFAGMPSRSSPATPQ